METIFNNKIDNIVPLNANHAKIITVEGIDGAGKTTVVNDLLNKIKQMGYKAEHFNTSSLYNIYWDTVKKGINRDLIDKDVNQLLHSIAFLTYIKTIFIELLNQNDYVISEWYIYGKMVLSELYSEAKESVSLKMLRFEMEEGNIVMPDYSFYLDIEPEIAYRRILDRKESMEDKEKIEMLRKANNIWKKYIDNYDIMKIDANSNVENISHKILKRMFDRNG